MINVSSGHSGNGVKISFIADSDQGISLFIPELQRIGDYHEPLATLCYSTMLFSRNDIFTCPNSNPRKRVNSRVNSSEVNAMKLLKNTLITSALLLTVTSLWALDRDIMLQPQSTAVRAPSATTELEIDFRKRKAGSIKAESFKEKGVTFKIIGNTQSCGEAVLEMQHHKLLGSYLAPTSAGERGSSCAHLQIDISFTRPVAEVSLLTHAELGTMELWVYNEDGNSIGRRLSTEVTGENTRRLTIASPGGDATIYRAYFYGRKNSLIYSLRARR